MAERHPFVNRLQRRTLTARRAGFAIALTTLTVTLAGGALMTIADRKDFPTLGRGLWWAVQTVTTVGYGDVVPHTTTGRFIGTVVMVTGIGFLTVVTAAITATFVETARRRFGVKDDRLMDDRLIHELGELGRRLDRIEQRLDER
jgi:voltage-gated potassium channel